MVTKIFQDVKVTESLFEHFGGCGLPNIKVICIEDLGNTFSMVLHKSLYKIMTPVTAIT